MIRKAFSLLIEAALFELRRLREEPAPVVAPVPMPVTAPAVLPSDPWESPAFHVSTLPSLTCPDCGAAKRAGSYRCNACVAQLRGKA